MRTAFPHCRICGAPRVSYSTRPLCREHYNEHRRSTKPPQKRGRKVVEACRICGGPRKEGISLALCPDHYREYAMRRMRKQRGMDPDAPVKKVDVTKCSRCDEPRLPYGTLCRGCHNAMHAERRRKAGVQTWAEHVARIAVSKPACITVGCGEPTTSRFAKFCRACYERRQEAKVKASSRACHDEKNKSSNLAVRFSEAELDVLKAALPKLRKQTGENWNLSRMVREGARMLIKTGLPGRGIKDAVVGPPPVTVTVVRSADEMEREQRAREWAEYLERKRKEYDA